MNTPDFSQLHNVLPERFDPIITSSCDTELSFFDIASRCAAIPGTVVLASGGNSECARYHILGINPLLTLTANLHSATITCCEQSLTVSADPFEVLQHLVHTYHFSAYNDTIPFRSGLLGYLSYDLKDCTERLPRTSIDDLHLPHLYMIIPSVVLIEDLELHTLTLHIANGDGRAEQHLESFNRLIASPVSGRTEDIISKDLPVPGMTRNDYMHAVDSIRDYIIRGEVYQVNMSQRFETDFHGDPFDLFLRLFETNPAPFFSYINADNHHVISTSPERFIALKENHVETRPIKGTRPRGATEGEDERLKTSLQHSHKDDAELSMIVDLLRNDIGKVCREGSVNVQTHKRVEAYENVFHMVSVITGTLENDNDAVDLIRATFPGGSITGCPKIRAMELIDELEPVRRHVYTGSIGYISFHDTMDLSIAIRTATIKDNHLYFSVGGGVVYDSDPADEFEETLHKGKTLMQAITSGYAPPARSTEYAWCNGMFRPLTEISVPVTDMGFMYGFGIFETIRVEQGTILRLNAHLDRFNNSWRVIFNTEPPDITWDSVIAQVIAMCNLRNECAAVKILAAAGSAATPDATTLLVTARKYVHRLKAAGREGLHCIIYPHRRYSHLSSFKTMNYQFCKMAHDYAHRLAADEALILNPDGTVCESTTANILCIIKGVWYSPFSEHVLPGTMERAVLEHLNTQGISVKHRPLSGDDLKNADQVFLTNALMGIVPVIQIDAAIISGNGTHIAAEINSALINVNASGENGTSHGL